MNKLYQSVYSHATQSWVAVSELTKAKGKRSGAALVAVSALAALGTSLTAQAQTPPMPTLPGVYFNNGSTVTTDPMGNVMSGCAVLSTNGSVIPGPIVGADNCVSTDKATQDDRALFYGLVPSAGNLNDPSATSLTLGGELYVNSGSLGLGGAQTGASGTNSAAGSMRIGDAATLAGNSGLNAIAVGVSTTALGDGAVAIGKDASATLAGGVALGSNSVASTAAGVVGYDPKSNTSSTNTSATWVSTLGAVSVGDGSTATRQITSVAAGTLDTDAVNVAQLKANQTHYYSVNGSTSAAGSNYANDGATGTNSMASGVAATSAGTNSTALGYTAASNAANSVALGSNSTVAAAATSGVAIGNNASTTVAGGVAMGESSVSSTAAGVAGYVPPSADATQTAAITATTSTAGSVAVGDAGAGVYRQITGVAAGTENSDAVNVAQLKATVTTAVGSVSMNFAGNSGDSVAVANGGTLAITGAATTAGTYTGANIKTVTDAATGAVNIQMAENPEFTSVTTGNTTINNNGLTINNGPSVTSTGIDANNTVISNVAPGVAGTDAVNVNQLRNVSNQIGRIEDKLSGGIAASAALAVVTPVEPGTYHLSGGAAYYNGGYGLGLNLLKRSDSGRTTMHAGVAWGSGGGGALVRVGAGFSFGGN